MNLILSYNSSHCWVVESLSTSLDYYFSGGHCILIDLI